MRGQMSWRLLASLAGRCVPDIFVVSCIVTILFYGAFQMTRGALCEAIRVQSLRGLRLVSANRGNSPFSVSDNSAKASQMAISAARSMPMLAPSPDTWRSFSADQQHRFRGDAYHSLGDAAQ